MASVFPDAVGALTTTDSPDKMGMMAAFWISRKCGKRAKKACHVHTSAFLRCASDLRDGLEVGSADLSKRIILMGCFDFFWGAEAPYAAIGAAY